MKTSYSDAAEDLEMALEIDPLHSVMNKELSYKLCDCYLHLAKYEKAKKSCEEVNY